MNKLKEYCINITDGEHGSVKEDLSGEYYFLNNNNIMNSGITIKPNDRRISKTDYNRIHRRTKLAKGDIVIATCGTIGKCQIIRDERINYEFSRSVGIIKCDPSRLLPDFLFYYLINPYTQNRIKKISEGGVQKHFYISAMQEFDVEVPPIVIQKKIIALFASIDKKIQCNIKINDTLEQMAKTIYDYWFTQFDFPDENGKPYRSSGGKMVWNKQLKREIPVGWSVASIVDNPISSMISTGVEYFTSKQYLATSDIDGTNISFGAQIEYETRESRANMQPRVNSVWFAKMKNSVKHLFLNEQMKEIIENTILSTGFCGIQCSELSFEYVSSFVSSSYFEKAKDTAAYGSTQEAVNYDDMLLIKFIIPDFRVLSGFHELCKGIYSQISKNICENQYLINIRDWLLPLLMNGQAIIA